MLLIREGIPDTDSVVQSPRDLGTLPIVGLDRVRPASVPLYTVYRGPKCSRMPAVSLYRALSARVTIWTQSTGTVMECQLYVFIMPYIPVTQSTGPLITIECYALSARKSMSTGAAEYQYRSDLCLISSVPLAAVCQYRQVRIFCLIISQSKQLAILGRLNFAAKNSGSKAFQKLSDAISVGQGPSAAQVL